MTAYDEIRRILNELEGYDNCVSQNGEIVEFNFGTSYDEIIKEIGRLRLIFHPDLYQHNNLSIKEEECNRITAGLNRLKDILTYRIENGNIAVENIYIYNVFNKFAKKQEEDRANKRMKYFNFDGGEIKQEFDENQKPKMRKIQYTTNDGTKQIPLYVYEWTDKNNRRCALYSELDINELYRFRDTVLSEPNLRRIALYDVENQDSQYGYAGKVGKVGNQSRIITNPYVKNHFREEYRANKRMKYFNFDGGEIKQEFVGNDKPKTLKISYTNNYGEKEITLYVYEWIDNNNIRFTLYSEYDIDKLFRFKDVVLSPSNLRRIALYDVENPDSQYGYAGKVGKVGNQSRIITNPYVKNHFRDEKIKSQSKTPTYIELHNGRFRIEPCFEKAGRQMACKGIRNGKPSNIYIYSIEDECGKFGPYNQHYSYLWTHHPWKELSDPGMREYFENVFSIKNIMDNCKGIIFNFDSPLCEVGYVDNIKSGDEIKNNIVNIRIWHWARLQMISIGYKWRGNITTI